MDVFVTPIMTQSQQYPFTENIQAAQLQAGQDLDGIVLMPPHYQFYTYMSTDGIHLGGQGRRYYAELAASIVQRRRAGLPYLAPHLVSAVRSGATITATCHFPGGGGGVRDTTTFGDPTTGSQATNWAAWKYGVAWFDATANAYINVTDATLSGNTLTVTLASAPAAGGQLRVAQQPWPGGSPPAAWAPRCNFRDAVMSATLEGGLLAYHYLMPQALVVS
jgi:hypothetical protein